MIEILKKSFFKHAYLFIAAAWLYTFSFIFENYIAFTSSASKVKSAIEKDIKEKESDFLSVYSKQNLEQLISEKNNAFKQLLIQKPYGIYVHQLNDRGNPFIIYWNSNISVPATRDLLQKDGRYFLENTNGYYYFIKRTSLINGRQYLASALIPIKWKYAKSTHYLKNSFAVNAAIDDYYNITQQPTVYPVKNSEGKVLFYLDQVKESFTGKPNFITIVFRIIAALSLLLFIHSLSIELFSKAGFRKGFLFLISNVVILRFLSYRFSFLFDFKGYALFDPEIYNAGILHRSLGDLAINSMLVFWVIIFIKQSLLKRSVNLNRFSARIQYIIAFTAISLLILSGFEIGYLIKSLVVDSKISFDVTNFFSLSIYTFISFIVIVLLFISFFHLSHILSLLINPVFKKLPVLLFIITVSGLIFLTLSLGSAMTPLRMVIIVWLLLYIAIIRMENAALFETITRSNLYLFWIIFFSATATGLLLAENRIKERTERQQFAENITRQTDQSSEKLIRLATEDLNDTFFKTTASKWFYEQENQRLKDSIINESFSGYLNKFDTHIYTFDQYYRPIFNEDSITYSVVQSIINRNKKSADGSSLYSFEIRKDRYGFVYEKEMRHNGKLYGYFYILAKPRTFKTEGLYPELFKTSVTASVSDNSNYAYAIYNRFQLIKNANSFSFPQYISKADLPRYDVVAWKVKDGFEQLWYKAPDGKVVVVVKNHSMFIETLTLFAYVFLCFLILTLILHTGDILLSSRFNLENLKPLLQLNIRNQVQATIVFVSVFSFVVIGVATISFFIMRFRNSNEERLSRTTELLRNEIEFNLRRQLQNPDAGSILISGILEREITEVAEMHNADVNVYDLSGELRTSTQPYIFNKHIVSNRMHPEAFYQLHYNRRIQWIQQENLNTFTYLSMYVPVRDAHGKPQAYLNVPFLNSQNELKQEISNFLVTLINLNAFIFLLSGAIAVLVANRITKSLSLIAGKMKEISLGKPNQEIEWHHHDEIGALVAEYNKMVKQLEESAKILAKTEREGAWREMAKQVAHEIKNPLTPMKLSIQYLQRAIDTNADNVKALSQKVADTLVQQIDQLAKIANDFSQFANINTISKETFDVTEIIQLLTTLHNADSKVHIEHITEPGNYLIAADKNQINRLFTNLIKNAIEAAGKQAEAYITIKQSRIESTIIISVTDNGTGIPVEMWNKIFSPNFTTKSSGTGLGLAICKGIVENAGGSIWFETEQQKGTCFYVSLPAAKS